MGFNDHPIVDNNSKRSEESVNVLRPLFSRKNGFIFREENPDYGVDVDVELVTDGENASSQKFAIQIKSKEELKITTEKDEKLVSLVFDVSRIGYLARRPPAYGLIVAYDEKTQISYFGYVEDIVARLDTHPHRSGWREQDSTTILFPPNIIDSNAVNDIHKKMVLRHENHEKLIKEEGKNFNIPCLRYASSNPGEIDFSDPKQTQEFLSKYGTYLLNQGEFKWLLALLDSVSQAAINADLNLSFLSAITYAQIGNIADAEYHLRKVNKKYDELSDEQKGIIQFSELRVEFSKGNVNYKEFLEKLSDLKQYVKDPENLLTIEINTVFFELTDNALSGKVDLEAREKIDELTKKINETELDDSKRQLLLVYHAENIQAYGLEAFLHFNMSYQLKESLNIDVPVEARVAFANLTVAMNKTAMEIVLKAYQYADAGNMVLLKASAAQNLGEFFFNLHYYLLMQGIGDEPIIDEDRVQLYQTHQNYSIIAYNEFRELRMLKNAHEALTMAYELQYLCLKMHLTQIGPRTGAELLKLIGALEDEADLPAFVSAAEIIVAGTERRKASASTKMEDLTDEGINFLAENALKAYGLPTDRLANIKSELKTMQIFEAKCKNPNVELVFNNLHHQNNSTRYASKPEFIIRHKTLLYESKPSKDIIELLEQYKHLL